MYSTCYKIVSNITKSEDRVMRSFKEVGLTLSHLVIDLPN